MREKLDKIINTAIWAPSGDNVQPWRFVMGDSSLQVYNIPTKDQSLYNFEQSASFIAIGALIENILVLAKQAQLSCDYSFFPLTNNHELVADIKFSASTTHDEEDLANYIQKRCTNRKPYSATPISVEKKTSLALSFDNSIGRLVFVEKEDKDFVAEILSRNEKIVLENKYLHNFLFQHITWTDQEDRLKKGFFVKTLEINGVKKMLFFLLSYWRVLNFFKIFSVSDQIAKENATLYKHSAAIGAVAVKGDQPLDFVKAGIAMQRIWLTATKHGLSIQPLMGIVLLANKIKHKNITGLSEEHVKIITSACDKVNTVFGFSENEVPAFVFRIGTGIAPSARTRRREPLVEKKF